MTNRISLVYPPLRDPSSLPFLFSSCVNSLRAGDGEIASYDLNLAFWEYISSPSTVSRCYKALEEEWEHWSQAAVIPPEKQERVYFLTKCFLRRSYLEKYLQEAVETLQQETEVSLREWARNLLQGVLRLYSLAYEPTEIALNDLTMIFSSESTRDIQASVNHASNPFVDWYNMHSYPDSEEWVIWIETDQQLIPAATLVNRLKERQPQAKITMAGPFFATFGASLLKHPLPEMARTVAVSHPTELLDALQDEKRGRWGIEALAEKAYWTPYTDIFLHSQWRSDPALQRWLQEKDYPSTTRFYIAEPTTVEEGDDWSRLFRQTGQAWGLYLKFNQFLTPEVVQRWREQGLGWVHWELKGWFMGETEEDCRKKYRKTLFACNREKIPLLQTFVLGYPGTTPAQFASFATFIAEESGDVHRRVRFKLFRLYKDTPLWKEREKYGLTAVGKGAQEKDLQRGYSFQTATGWDSNQFHEQAQPLVQKLQRGKQGDFPLQVMAVDDLPLEQTHGEGEREASLLSQASLLTVSPHVSVTCLAFAPGELQQRVQPLQAGQGKEYAFASIAAKPTFVLYNGTIDRFMVINKAVEKVVAYCQEPVSLGELLQRFPSKHHQHIRSLVEKLLHREMLFVVHSIESPIS